MKTSTIVVEINMPITEETVWPEYPPTQRVEVGGEITYEDSQTRSWRLFVGRLARNPL